MTFVNVLLIILTVLVVLLAVLYFVGRKLQKKQAVQQEQMEAAKQTVSMLVIDKKRMKLKEAGLPQAVLESTPRLMRGTKLPIVKARVGANTMNFIADARVFEIIPVKKEVKATISGLYITDVKGIRGGLEIPKKKEGFFKRMKNKITGKSGKEEASTKAAKNTASKTTASKNADNTGASGNTPKPVPVKTTSSQAPKNDSQKNSQPSAKKDAPKPSGSKGSKGYQKKKRKK